MTRPAITTPFYLFTNETPDHFEGHPGFYAFGVGITILSAAAYIGAFFVASPLAAAIQIVALGVLTAASYGIINDQLACRQCIEYFTVGHTSYHKRLLKTEDATLNGLVWGIHATWFLGAIAGVALVLVVRVTKRLAITALSLTPFALIGLTAVLMYAHMRSKQEEKKWNEANPDTLNAIFNGLYIVPSKGYHAVNLDRIPEHKRAAYLGVGKRNEISYIYMALLAGALIVGIIAADILF